MVGPALAKKWLATNPGFQRRVRARRVQHYVRVMRSGDWGESNDLLCFDWNGHLINGQHRLLAVIETGFTLAFAVRRNMNPESYADMDDPGIRYPVDYMPEKCRHVLSGAAKFTSVWIKGEFPHSPLIRPTMREVFEIIDQNPKLLQSTDLIHGYGIRLSCLCRAGSQAFLHWYYVTQENQHRGKVDQFFHDVGTGEGLKQGHPGLALKNRVLVSSKLTGMDRQAYVLKGLKAYLLNQNVKTMLWKRKEFPSLELR